MAGIEIVEVSSPFANAARRIEFPWYGAGALLPVELRLRFAGRHAALQAELWTNANNSGCPAEFVSIPLRYQSSDGDIALFRGGVTVNCVGNFRITARATLDGGSTYTWAGDCGCADLCFRPRPPSIDNLNIEVVSVAHCKEGGGTFQDMMSGGAGYHLEWLAQQGKNCIWLLPVFEVSPASRVVPSDDWPSPYAARDLFSLSPQLVGGLQGMSEEEAQSAARRVFRSFVDKAHALGIQVVLDLALNHVGLQHRFTDLFVSTDTSGAQVRQLRHWDFSNMQLSAQRREELSRRLADLSQPRYLESVAPWMFGCHDTFPQGASSAARIAPGGWFEWHDTLQLNHGRRRLDYNTFQEDTVSQEQLAVQAWLGRVLLFWAVDMGVDGFRLDHLAGLPRRMLEHECNILQSQVDRHEPGKTILLIGEDHDTASETQHFVDLLQIVSLHHFLGDLTPQRLQETVEAPWFCHLLNYSTHDEDRLAQRLTSITDSQVALSCLTGLGYFVGGAVLEVVGDQFAATQRLPLRQNTSIVGPKTNTETNTEKHNQLPRSLGRMARLRQSQPALLGKRRSWLTPATGGIESSIVALARHPKDCREPGLLVFANLSNQVQSNIFLLDDISRRCLAASRFYQALDLNGGNQPLWPQAIAGHILQREGVYVELQPWQLQVLLLVSSGVDAVATGEKNVELAGVDSGEFSVPLDEVAGDYRETFCYSGAAGQSVELRGDFPEWKFSVAMEEVEPGRYQRHLDLKPGLYRYQFSPDRQHYQLDPNGQAVDYTEGYANALRAVAGAQPPLLFVPDNCHQRLDHLGHLTVQLMIAGDGSSPEYLWCGFAEAAPLVAPFQTVLKRHGSHLLRAQLQLDPCRLPLGFGFSADRAFEYALPKMPPAQALCPTWAKGAVFYAIFVDRWLRSTTATPDSRNSERQSPSTAQTFYGGDIGGVTQALDYLCALGVDGLILTPLTPSPTPHRYDSTDLTTIDPLLGGTEALLDLLREAKKRGLRVVVDVSLTHVNQQHPAFVDLLQRQQQSPYQSWFKIRSFPVRAGDPSTLDLYPTRPELPLLDLTPGPAREHVLSAVEKLVALGVDGLRLDAVNDAPADFWQELRQRMRRINPQLLLLGEIVSDRPARFALERGVDSATDFNHRQAVIEFFGHKRIDAQEFFDRVELNRFRRGPFASSFYLHFLDNHDTGRFVSICGYFDRLRLALAYLLFSPHPVWLTYGTECGLASGVPESELDDAWPERIAMLPLEQTDCLTKTALQQLLRWRHRLAPLDLGDLELVAASGKQLVLQRSGRSAAVRAYYNAADVATAVLQPVSGAVLLLAINDAMQDPQQLPPRAARIYWVGGDPEQLSYAQTTAPGSSETAARQRLDREFRQRLVTLESPPTKLYLNLTERCSLACRHCITQAPVLTASGQGRVMGEEVVAALKPSLKHISYMAFPHAGEPTIAPQLVPLLRELQQERAGQPTVVHILTNGLGLSPERFWELVALGVVSWSFSVDGMSSDTHDALRLGSNINELLSLLKQIAERRKQQCTCVTLGIAWTVTRHNIDEIPQLIRFAAEVGLDWIKLEEVFPVNAVARDLAQIAPQELQRALTEAVQLAADFDLPLLDHVQPMEVLKCQLGDNPQMRRRSHLDELVNQMEINSCRLPWELCCVEPNGDIKPVSFVHPVAGNLLRTPLHQIWNSRVFVAERQQALRRQLCPSMPLCPGITRNAL